MKERAADGDDLAKLILERFWDKPDSLLLRFLRARKFDVGRAHELMKGEQQKFPPVKYNFLRSIFISCCGETSFWHPDAPVIEGETSFVLLVCVNPVHH